MLLTGQIEIYDEGQTADASFWDGSGSEPFWIFLASSDVPPDGERFCLTDSSDADARWFATWPEAVAAFRREVAAFIADDWGMHENG